MGFLSRLFGLEDDDCGHEPPSMPWDRRPSILELVRSQIVTGKPGMPEGGYNLPDDDRIAQGSKIRWAPSAMDGVMTHHMRIGEKDEAVRKMVEIVLAYSREPTAKNKAAVYQYIITEEVVSIIGPVIEALVKESGIKRERLYGLAHSFVTETPDRGPVQFGIALLFDEPSHKNASRRFCRPDLSSRAIPLSCWSELVGGARRLQAAISVRSRFLVHSILRQPSAEPSRGPAERMSKHGK